MKNLYRNGIVLVLAIGFLCLNFAGAAPATGARQAKNAKKPAPTPAKKAAAKDAKSKPAANAKPTPKTTNAKAKPTPKASDKAKSSKSEKTDSKSRNDSQKPKTASDQKSKASAPKSKSSDAKSKKETVASNKKETKKETRPAAKTKTEQKPAVKTNPKPTGEQIIVTTTDARLRQQPKSSAPLLNVVKIGKLLNVVEKNGSWYLVEYENERSGWLSNAVVKTYETDERDRIYQSIADRYARDKSLDFAAAAEVSDFLRTAQALAKADSVKAELGFKRLQILAAALKSIPAGKADAFPYKNFLQAHEKEVVYSEPSATWLVRSDLFWELHTKYMQLPAAEDIAWAAARNRIPGECEGYINCRLYVLRAMEGEYLNFYPDGKHSRQALELVTANLNVMVADMNNKATFQPLADISDRAEFNRFLTELRTIISKISDADKARPLQSINQLGEGYK